MPTPVLAAFTSLPPPAWAAIGAAIMAYFFVGLAVAAIVLVGKWKVFEKAGQPGWAAIVPIYNLVILFRISGQSGWWALSLLAGVVPILGALFFLVVLIRMVHRISVRFGHGAGFTCGLILLSFVFWPILGFGSSRYRGPAFSGEAGAVPPQL